MPPIPLVVRGAPEEYVCRSGCWNDLEDCLKKRNIHQVLVLHGRVSWAAAKPYFPAMKSVKQVFMYYGKKCTDERIEHFASMVKTEKLDGIIAIGGGKVTDVAKAAADAARVPVIILPTLASTCAAWTPLSVVYREDGSMDRVSILGGANTLVLVEPLVILHSPKELLVAGIGDTLAKWYESDAIISQLSVKPVSVQVAAYAAMRCLEVLLANGEAALQAMQDLQINDAFLAVVETNIVLAGMVGGFGDEYGRVSGAHTIHDALTVLPPCQKVFHGNVVAYSILVQLTIEKRMDEIGKLLPFYRALGLPTCLAEINLPNATKKDIQTVAQHTAAEGRAIHLMKEHIDALVVEDAIEKLEQYVAE